MPPPTSRTVGSRWSTYSRERPRRARMSGSSSESAEPSDSDDDETVTDRDLRRSLTALGPRPLSHRQVSDLLAVR